MSIESRYKKLFQDSRCLGEKEDSGGAEEKNAANSALKILNLSLSSHGNQAQADILNQRKKRLMKYKNQENVDFGVNDCLLVDSRAPNKSFDFGRISDAKNLEFRGFID